jgi:hypothetical protein
LTLAIVTSTSDAFTLPLFWLKKQSAAKKPTTPSDLDSTKSVSGGGGGTRSVGENSDDEDGSAWDSWMKKGRKTSSLVYREPEELGGIVRPDRYSSR